MFSQKTYVDRRNVLKERLQSGLILLLGNDDSPMNYPGNPYPYFRQDSSFLYYCGVDVPGLAVLMVALGAVAEHAVKHNDVYWDKISLVEISGDPGPEPPTPEPPAGEYPTLEQIAKVVRAELGAMSYEVLPKAR